MTFHWLVFPVIFHRSLVQTRQTKGLRNIRSKYIETIGIVARVGEIADSPLERGEPG